MGQLAVFNEAARFNQQCNPFAGCEAPFGMLGCNAHRAALSKCKRAAPIEFFDGYVELRV